MARIRSIHPGLPSDEAYMAMSVWSKAAWPLLWTECDDNGVFEWKPMVLKARIFPADHVDFGQLLEEMERLNCVRVFTVDGKRYGAVRNFRKYQRPKKPTGRYPIPDEIRTYVCLSDDGSEPVPHQEPPEGGTSTEKSPQMEEEGGRREEGGDTPSLRSGVNARAMKIPGGWQPTSDDWAFAAAQGFSAREVGREAQKFRDFNIGKGSISEDWSATWRVWVTKGAEMQGKSPRQEPGAVEAGFYAAAESAELSAWDEHQRQTSGTTLPRDRNGGWRVAAQWPPGHDGIPDFLRRQSAA